LADFTYSELRRLQQEEKSSAALVQLSPDFYTGLEAMVRQKKDALSKTHGIMEIKEFENTLKIIRDIYSIREQKILFKALRTTSHHDSAGMTVEEHQLFDSVVSTLKDSKRNLERFLGDDAQTERLEPEGSNGGNIKKVRFLKEVPAFRGLDNNVYGPFKTGDTLELPLSETSALIKGKIAEGL